MDVPIQARQYRKFHLLDVTGTELSPTQIRQCRQFDLAYLVYLDCDVQRRQTRQ